MKKLSDLLNFSVAEEIRDLEVSDVIDDSRKATLNSMFVAINGNNTNGTLYIRDAIENGAKFIVINTDSADIIESFSLEKLGENEILIVNDIFFISVKNTRKTLAYICSKFWETSFDNIVAVTGTNGKSSTVDIVRQIWIYIGKKAASIGTLGVITKDTKQITGLTSPGAVTLRHIFSKLNSKDIRNIAIEASSHGIDQYRLDDINFSICAFTNFTQDHLDYHHNFENYWLAKERLFSDLANNNSIFVINSDDEISFNRLSAIAHKRHIKFISYGKKSPDIKLISVIQDNQFQKVKIRFFNKEYNFDLPLAGDFQVYNALCAIGICYSTGESLNNILYAIEHLKPISGRLELVANKNGGNIYVDYAHTPDALKNALISLRKHTANRLHVVFGCGGNRDADKRHLMGEIAKQYADNIIVTDDNPRNENSDIIRSMILNGCPMAKEIKNREKAIAYAINQLNSGDVLLIAGKGHEDYQIIGNKTIHFNDKEIILRECKKCY